MSDRSSEKPDDGRGYTPTVSGEQVERIRLWHERAYREGRAEGVADQTFDYFGFPIVVPPDVMPVTPMSHLLGEAVLAEVQSGDKVLDMGTGSGINAILAASKGGSACRSVACFAPKSGAFQTPSRSRGHPRAWMGWPRSLCR